MRINRKLLPIKMHYFFFMAASGPILPYLTVYGKQLGISEVVMGSITAVLPIAFLLAKPAFGFLADYFTHLRKMIFVLLIPTMSLSYVSLYFIPPIPHGGTSNGYLSSSAECNLSDGNSTQGIEATVNETSLGMFDAGNASVPASTKSICAVEHESRNYTTGCEQSQQDPMQFYASFSFYGFVIFMSLAMILYNVTNSISDAICFDILGKTGQSLYGKQRVWGAVGFGLTALVAGFGMDFYSVENVKNYTPAFGLVLIFTLVDLLVCAKLKLPETMSSRSIFGDVAKLLKHGRIVTFLGFATLAGFIDSFIIYYMFWFLEDLAAETNETGNVKILEGLTVAAETLGGEIIFFPLAGDILNRIGYNHSFTICFLNYAVRLALISLVPSPWWILAVELFMQGPTYAFTYTVIVAYANAVSPPGTSATMQGLVAGVDDGLGYALGSLVGGFLYKIAGGRTAFRYYSLISLICCCCHFAIHKFFFNVNEDPGKIAKDANSIEAAEGLRAGEDEKSSKL